MLISVFMSTTSAPYILGKLVLLKYRISDIYLIYTYNIYIYIYIYTYNI